MKTKNSTDLWEGAKRGYSRLLTSAALALTLTAFLALARNAEITLVYLRLARPA
jgi:hypothetical protein